MTVEAFSPEGILRRQRRVLLRLRGRLAEDVEAIDRELAVLDDAIRRAGLAATGEQAKETGLSPPVASAGRRTLRQMVLDALEDLGVMSTSKDLTGYLDARFGRSVIPARFGTLAADEMASFDRTAGARSAWLCFAIDIATGKPIKHMWARSDWALESRLVGPSTPRLQRLKLTRRLCELALSPMPGMASPDRLPALAGAYAADLPGSGNTSLANSALLLQWAEVAADLEARLGPADQVMRERSSKRLQGQDDRSLLFGPVRPMGPQAAQVRPSPIDVRSISPLGDGDQSPSRRRVLATVLPPLVRQLAGDGAVLLQNLYEAVELRYPELVDDELDDDGKPQWRHEMRWEIETLVGDGLLKRRRELGRGWYSAP